jgi:hypothetical protein
VTDKPSQFLRGFRPYKDVFVVNLLQVISSLLMSMMTVERAGATLFIWFLPIRQEISDVRSSKTTLLSGRDTPTVSNAGKAEVKPVAKGREKG